jgi:hypothetical protein
MTPLRKRMLEDLQIRNYAPTTVAAYIRSVAEFAKHFDKSPDLLGSEQIREYQLYLIKEKGVSLSSYTTIAEISPPFSQIPETSWLSIVRADRHVRICSLFTNDDHYPKLDVTGDQRFYASVVNLSAPGQQLGRHRFQKFFPGGHSANGPH